MGVVEISDLNRFADTVQEFFENFGEIAKRFTPEQVDQGLWYLFCDPIWLSHLVFDEIPSPQIATLTHAMYYPFRDYYMPMEMEYPGTAFYMWWDNFSSGCRNPALDEAAIAVLEKILALPSPLCREAALHGLNHLFPDPRAAALIDRYLDEHGRSLSKEEIEYAKACRAGDVI
jgi:hypothetical protein